MEAKPAPLQQDGGAGFVEVEQQSDPVVTFLSRLGVVEADKVAASLRRQHLDEASLTALEADSLMADYLNWLGSLSEQYDHDNPATPQPVSVTQEPPPPVTGGLT